MNLLDGVRDRLGLSPAAAGRSHDQGPRPMTPAYGFEAHPEGDEVHIRLEGEIDICCALEVRKRMVQALDLGPGAVRLDLRGVIATGSSAMNVLFQFAKRLQSEKRPVSCVANQRVARIFGMCGLALLLNVRVEE
jgi:anti-anti-sigma factor